MYAPGVACHEILTREQERSLAQAVEAGAAARERITDGVPQLGDDALVAAGVTAAHRFVECNMGLVVSTAGRFNLPDRLERSDLIQEGVLGVIRAVEKFDWRKGYKFSTYASWWIRAAIGALIREQGEMVRQPRGRPLTDREQAHLSNLSRPLSLDWPTTDAEGANDSGGVLLDIVADPADDREQQLLDEEEIDELHAAVDRLPVELRDVLRSYYGLLSGEPMMVTDIAAEIGVTTATVYARRLAGLRKLRIRAAAAAHQEAA